MSTRFYFEGKSTDSHINVFISDSYCRNIRNVTLHELEDEDKLLKSEVPILWAFQPGITTLEMEKMYKDVINYIRTKTSANTASIILQPSVNDIKDTNFGIEWANEVEKRNLKPKMPAGRAVE